MIQSNAHFHPEELRQYLKSHDVSKVLSDYVLFAIQNLSEKNALIACALILQKTQHTHMYNTERAMAVAQERGYSRVVKFLQEKSKRDSINMKRMRKEHKTQLNITYVGPTKRRVTKKNGYVQPKKTNYSSYNENEIVRMLRKHHQ